MAEDDTQDFNSALDTVNNFLTSANENYQKNKDLYVKTETQVKELKADLELLSKKKIAAHKGLEAIAQTLENEKAEFNKQRQEFEESLAEAKKLHTELAAREKAASDKLEEARIKIDAAEALNKELKAKEYQLRDLEGVIASRG